MAALLAVCVYKQVLVGYDYLPRVPRLAFAGTRTRTRTYKYLTLAKSIGKRPAKWTSISPPGGAEVGKVGTPGGILLQC
jgi:hypothetical protein